MPDGALAGADDLSTLVGSQTTLIRLATVFWFHFDDATSRARSSLQHPDLLSAPYVPARAAFRSSERIFG